MMNDRDCPRIRTGRRSSRVKKRPNAALIDDLSPYQWFALVIERGKVHVVERMARKVGLATFAPTETKKRWSNHVDRHRRKLRERTVQRFPGLLFVGFPVLPDHLVDRVELHPWHLIDEIWFCRGVLSQGGVPRPIPLHAHRGHDSRCSTNIGLSDVLAECKSGFSPARSDMPTGREYEPGDTVEFVGELFDKTRFKVIDIDGNARTARVASVFFGQERVVEVEVGNLAKVSEEG